MQQTPRQCSARACARSPRCSHAIAEHVEGSGGRLTRPRVLLLQTICAYGAHFTAEQLKTALADRGHDLALTTIYRNLPALVAAGIIRRTTLQEEQSRGAATYEHVWGRPHHDHLLCAACGRTVEFQYDAIEVLQQEVARQHGFELHAHHLELVGRCPACRAAEQRAKEPAS